MNNLSRKEMIELLRKAAAGKLSKDDFLLNDQDQIWMNLDGAGFRFEDQFKTVEQMNEAVQKGGWQTVTIVIN